MIRVRELRVDYDDTCAVRDLSFEVAPGEVFGLIGPNGAGKTTTLRALLGLIEPTYGDIELAGIDIRDRPRDASRLAGFMPDFPPMYEDLQVWEFLDLFASSYFLPRDQRPRRIEQALEQVGLLEKYDALVPELSRGMRQRLMLAKTLLPEPQVVLLDEPASGMDPNGRSDLKKILRNLAAGGCTVLVSSHILSEMSEFCTSVGIMERGRMVVSGTVEAVAAQVLGHSGRVHVEVLGSPELLESLLRGRPLVGPCTWQGNRAEFRFNGDTEDRADLLADLLRAGVRVISFGRLKEDLEQIFLEVGAKELS